MCRSHLGQKFGDVSRLKNRHGLLRNSDCYHKLVEIANGSHTVFSAGSALVSLCIPGMIMVMDRIYYFATNDTAFQWVRPSISMNEFTQSAVLTGRV